MTRRSRRVQLTPNQRRLITRSGRQLESAFRRTLMALSRRDFLAASTLVDLLRDAGVLSAGRSRGPEVRPAGSEGDRAGRRAAFRRQRRTQHGHPAIATRRTGRPGPTSRCRDDSLHKVDDELALHRVAGRLLQTARRRTVGDRAGSRLSRSQPVALRFDGYLAQGDALRARGLRLDRPDGAAAG